MNLSNIFNKSNYIAFIKTAKETNLSTLFYRSITTLKDALLYPHWYQKQLPDTAALEKQQSTLFSYTPIISIVVPTYCTPIPFLHEMIQSVTNQTYSNWELCIADASPADSEVRPILTDYCQKDTRIKVQFLSENKGISGNTNYALKMTTGEFIGLLDHDDLLAPNALFEIVSALNRHPDIDVLYTDEDKIDMDSKTHYYPNFKPDYNKLLLQSCNYICHFFVFKRSIYNQTGLFDSSYDGSQDYHYILRATEIAKCVYHIPKMLYHWRVHQGSVAGNPAQKAYCYDAARRALQKNLDSAGISGKIEYSRLTGFYNTTYSPLQHASVSIISFSKSLQLEEYEKYDTQIIYAASIADIKTIPDKISSEYCIILGEGIQNFSQKSLILTLPYLQVNSIGAATYKITKSSKVDSLGLTYRNNQISKCYHAVPKEDAGFYGRAILDQFVPLCSPDAFACKTKYLKSFFDNIKQISPQEPLFPNSMVDISISFSLYLSDLGKYVVGMANVPLDCNTTFPILPSNSLLDSKKEKLKRVSQLYSVPPYSKC